MLEPKKIGTVIPSSKGLCEAMAGQVNWPLSSHIAELGAGEGVLTRILLKNMPEGCRLDSWEVNPSLLRQLRQIDDPRLIVHSESAEHFCGRYDAVFSGLPLLSLNYRVSTRILCQVAKNLRPDGQFIQFQYTTRSEALLSRYFNWQRFRVYKNIPPACVYVCQRKDV